MWWVWAFSAFLGMLLLLAAGTTIHSSMSGPRIHVHLLQSGAGSWHAVVVPDVEAWRSAGGRIEYPWGYHVSLPEDGSMLSDGLGFHRRLHRWALSRASVRTIFPSSPTSYIDAGSIPDEAWRVVVETLERDAFGNDVRRDQTSTALWDEPDYDALFASWEKRTTGWSIDLFWREMRDDIIIATCFASLIALARFALPLAIRRFPAGCCVSCGYDHAGLAPGEGQDDVTCPECGAMSTLDRKN